MTCTCTDMEGKQLPSCLGICKVNNAPNVFIQSLYKAIANLSDEISDGLKDGYCDGFKQGFLMARDIYG